MLKTQRPLKKKMERFGTVKTYGLDRTLQELSRMVLMNSIFLLFFLSFAKILHSFFLSSYVSICIDLQKTITLSSDHQALFCKYLHLQYNVFVVYDESKAVPQRPSHTRRGMIPTKLLLCTFVEIPLWHGCPCLL